MRKNGGVGHWVLAVALSVASGLLLAFALPPRGVAPLGWIAFLPLLLAARMSRPLCAAGCGLICSLACAIVLSGHLNAPYQFANLLGAFGSLGLVLALTAAMASAGKKLSPAIEPFAIACAGVTGELLSVCVFPVNVAISQCQNPAMLKLASFTAIWGVSFLVWLVPASMLAMVRKPKAAWPAFAMALVVLAASAIARFPAEQGGKILRVAAIQAPKACALSVTQGIRGQADVAVWPEHHLNLVDCHPQTAARSAGCYVVANYREPHAGSKSLNVGLVFSPEGKLIGRQPKRFPFGNENLTTARGRDSISIECGVFKAGIAICFDTQFTSVIRTLAWKGADVILVPVHDPEIPNSLLQHLHSAVVAFRAAENGVPIVWADANALSSIVDRSGRFVARAPAGGVEAVVARVALRSGTTVATRYGDWFAYLCVLAMLMTLSSVLMNRRSHEKGDCNV